MFNKTKFCDKCGFKNVENDKFCGGCGKDLNPKPKKKRNYAEGFFVLGFFLIWANLFDSTLGFDLSGSAEAAGRNSATFLWYLMYIIGGIRLLTKAKKKDSENIANESGDTSKTFWRKHTNLLKGIISVLVTFGILVVTIAYTINEYRSQDVTPILEDALYGTQQSGDKEFVGVLSDVFKGYYEATTKKFPATIALDSSNVLEYDSFETKASLQSSISLLKASISELSRADQILLEVKDEAREKIRNSNLSEEDKADVLGGFNKSANNTDQSYYTTRRYQTLKQTYDEMLQLYQFLLTNFNDYEISFDDNGEENIFFYSDVNIDTYNAHMTDIQKASLRFQEAEAALLAFVNQNLKDQGIDIKAEDIQNSLMQ